MLILSQNEKHVINTDYMVSMSAHPVGIKVILSTDEDDSGRWVGGYYVGTNLERDGHSQSEADLWAMNVIGDILRAKALGQEVFYIPDPAKIGEDDYSDFRGAFDKLPDELPL